MKKKQIAFLKQVVETPSPTGSEVAVAEIVRNRLMPIADEIHTDTMGSVHVTYEGRLHHSKEYQYGIEEGAPQEEGEAVESESEVGANPDELGEALQEVSLELSDDEDDESEEGEAVDFDEDDAEDDSDEAQVQVEMDADFFDGIPDVKPLTLMLAAHMDEIGLMVTYISPEGFLSIAPIGGVDAAILPGMRVDVHAESGVLRGVVGRKPIHLIDPDERKTVTPMDGLVIDLGLPGKKVRKLVKVGDSITIGVGFERFGSDMAVSRAFDDKVGVFITCRVMERLAKNDDYKGTFVGAITVQEEIGTRGAMTSAHSIRPDVALAFDVTHATDYPGIQQSKHGDIKCGGGPVIARGPNINPVVFERLVAAAEAEGIRYQLEAEPSVTGTDARSIQVSRGGIPTGLVSIPLRYMHTPTEVISLKDVEATIRLISRFASDLDEEGDFVPGHPFEYVSAEKLESEPYLGDYEDLVEEVERIAEELSDLQVITEAALDADADDEPVDDLFDEGFEAELREEFTSASSPFGRRQSAISAEFAGLDLPSHAARQQSAGRPMQPSPMQGANAPLHQGAMAQQMQNPTAGEPHEAAVRQQSQFANVFQPGFQPQGTYPGRYSGMQGQADANMQKGDSGINIQQGKADAGVQQGVAPQQFAQQGELGTEFAQQFAQELAQQFVQAHQQELGQAQAYADQGFQDASKTAETTTPDEGERIRQQESPAGSGDDTSADGTTVSSENETVGVQGKSTSASAGRIPSVTLQLDDYMDSADNGEEGRDGADDSSVSGDFGSFAEGSPEAGHVNIPHSAIPIVTITTNDLDEE